MQVVLRRLWIRITADRKRFAALCVMLVVGLLLWGRLIITSDVPRTAIAEPQVTVAPPRPIATAADKRPLRMLSRPLDAAPERDPLLTSDAHFPKPTNVTSLPEDDPKSGGQGADDPERADEQRTQELWRLVSEFRLDGVMHGRPMAVINGETFRLFDWIPAAGVHEVFFQLVEVADRSVVLACEGRRFRLNMDYPGIDKR